MNSIDNNQIDEKLLEIIKPGHQNVTRLGLYVSLIALLLIIVIFAATSRFILMEDRHKETMDIAIIGEEISHDVQTHLLTLSGALRPLTLASDEDLCMQARAHFDIYPEVLEVTRASAQGEILHSCANPSALGDITREAGQHLSAPETLRSLRKALLTRSSTFSTPYVRAVLGSPFTDLILPLDSSTDMIIARISLQSLLRLLAASRIGTERYWNVLIDGVPLVPIENASKHPDETTLSKALPPLPVGVELVISSSRLSIFYKHGVFIWSLVVLLTALISAVIVLLRYQWRQINTEQALRARIVVQQAMSQSFSDGLCVTDQHGKILFTNDSYRKLFRCDNYPLLGTQPSSTEWVETTLFPKPASSTEKTRGFHQESLVSRFDGSQFYCAVDVRPLLDNEERRLGWLVVYSDITQAKRAQQQVARAQERFVRVMETMDAAVSVVTLETDPPELLFANSRYSAMYGSTPSAHERLRSHLPYNLALELASAELFDEQTKRWFFVKLRTITWIDSSHVELLTINDVTERRLSQEAIEQQLKNVEQSSKLITMGETASSLAHELNQPLAAVQNYASAALTMLQGQKLSTEGARMALEKVINQTQRAAQIIKRIRSYAKRAEPIMSPIDIRRIVDETMELAQLTAKTLGMHIEVHVSPGLRPIICDVIMVEQVLLNLLKNAMEASEGTDSRQVELIIEPVNSMAQFSVCDHGIGIAHGLKDKLFEPFFSTKHSGLGIGLNICRSVIETHHGRLLHMDNPAGGTIFQFTLPMVADAVQS